MFIYYGSPKAFSPWFWAAVSVFLQLFPNFLTLWLFFFSPVLFILPKCNFIFPWENNHKHFENWKIQVLGTQIFLILSYLLKCILIFLKMLVITIGSPGSNEHYLLVKMKFAKRMSSKACRIWSFRYSQTIAELWPLNCRSWFFINLLITSTFTIALLLPLI